MNLNSNASGGTLSYSWAPGGETSADITVTTGGTYEVTVTDVNTTCETVADVTVSEFQTPVISISAPFFCQGDSTLVSAGVSGLDYAWTPSGNNTESFYAHQGRILLLLLILLRVVTQPIL